MVDSTAAAAIGPAEVFARMSAQWLDGGLTEESLAEDVVVEMPFASADGPSRIEGRAAFLEFAAAGRAGLPFRIEDCRNVVVHRTTDPEVIVVEYELVARMTATGRCSSAPFIGVLRARDGLVRCWREYQNVPVLQAAIAGHE